METRNDFTTQAIQEQLKRLLNSHAFEEATRSAKLLNHCVTLTLQGRNAELEEPTLAAAFLSDPERSPRRLKSMLRSIMKRTQHRLSLYYHSEGANDPILIDFFYGIYVPVIRHRATGRVFSIRKRVVVQEYELTPVYIDPVTGPIEQHSESQVVHASAVERAASPTIDVSAVERQPYPPTAEPAFEPLETPGGELPEVEPAPRHAPKRKHLRRSFPQSMLVACGLALAAGVGFTVWDPFGWFGLTRAKPDFAEFRKLTRGNTMSIDPTMSADGRMVIYASDQQTKGNLALWRQMSTGGEPVRLTEGEFDDHQPSISPDGNAVVYRSERDGGGLYVIASTGGTPRKLAGLGRSPRFSPDGKSVAYWEATMDRAGRDSKLFVIPLEGGTPRQLRGEFLTTQSPIWAPDGRHLLFMGRQTATGPAAQIDWWVTDLDDSTPINSGALSTAPRILNMSYGPPWDWQKEGNQVLFEAFVGEVKNLWSVPLTRKFTIDQRPRRITSGVAHESQPIASASGKRLVFTGLALDMQIWALTLNPAEGRAADDPKPFYTDAAIDYLPSMPLNGSRLAFVSERSGTPNVYVRDMTSGRETPAIEDASSLYPILSPDGSTLAVLTLDQRRRNRILRVIGPSANRSIPCEPCETLFGFSHDNRSVLFGGRRQRAESMYLGTVDAGSGIQRGLIGRPENIFSADFSSDGRWAAFSSSTLNGRLQIKIISAGQDAGAPIAVTDGAAMANYPRWSPDGRVLYFLADDDSFRCLYAIRIDPASGRPQGQRWSVSHFHKARQSLMAVQPNRQSLVITRDKALLTVETIRGNIWMADVQ